MTKEIAIHNLFALKLRSRVTSDREAIDMAIKALEQTSHLTDRPCPVCEFHTGNGCSKWDCVFEQQQDKVIHNHPCEDCYYNDGDVHAECVVCNKAESEDEE